jgi:hypothetical protein
MKKLFTLLVVIGILTSCEKNNTTAQAPPITVPVPVPDSIAILGDWLLIYSVNFWDGDTNYLLSNSNDSIFYNFSSDSLYKSFTHTAFTTVSPYSMDTISGELYIYLQQLSYSIANDTLRLGEEMHSDGVEDTFIRY